MKQRKRWGKNLLRVYIIMHVIVCYRSEDFQRCYVKLRATTSGKYCCTNKIGFSRDRMAVVDQELRWIQMFVLYEYNIQEILIVLTQLMEWVTFIKDIVFLHPNTLSPKNFKQIFWIHASFRVHGTKRLRVADASVMPHQISSSNLQGACYMIGEKTAASIIRDWNIN